METLGIIHTENLEKPILRSISAIWSFAKGSPHVMTDAEIQRHGSKERFRVSALWDTGASICAMSKELAYKMGLEPTGKTTCDVAGGGAIEAEIATVDFILPDGTTAETEVSIIEMGARPYNFIVGMSVILQGDFTIRKAQDGFDFEFSIPQS